MKQVLFVINTLGGAGAETAMIEMMRNMDPKKYEISLFVLLNQGELVHRLPEHVHVLNENISDCSVLSKEGKKVLDRYIVSRLFVKMSLFRNFFYVISNFFQMVGKGKILPDKLLWKVMSDGASRFEKKYDMAIAYLEGGSTYYVADHVSAEKKVAFVHIDYGKAGYTPQLDLGCYDSYDRICTVSDEVR